MRISTRKTHGGAKPLDAPPVSLMALAMWLGLAAAAAELLILGFQTTILGQFVQRSGVHLLWMIPAADLLFLSVPGLVLTVLHRRWPNRIPERLVTFTLVLITALAILLLVRRHIHTVALWLLGIGIGWQASRWIGTYARAVNTVVRRMLPPMLAAVGVVTVVVLTAPAVSERSRSARLPNVTSGGRNVVLIILDTVRRKSTGLEPGGRNTSPELSGIGSRGVTFTNAWAPSNWTPPSVP